MYLFLSLNSLVDICHFSVTQLQDLLLCGHPRGGRRWVGFPTVVASVEQRNPLPTPSHPLPGQQVAASRWPEPHSSDALLPNSHRTHGSRKSLRIQYRCSSCAQSLETAAPVECLGRREAVAVSTVPVQSPHKCLPRLRFWLCFWPPPSLASYLWHFTSLSTTFQPLFQ